jgi:hypothetical protein
MSSTFTYIECLGCGDKYCDGPTSPPDTVHIEINDSEGNLKCAALYCMDCFVELSGNEFVNNIVRSYGL